MWQHSIPQHWFQKWINTHDPFSSSHFRCHCWIHCLKTPPNLSEQWPAQRDGLHFCGMYVDMEIPGIKLQELIGESRCSLLLRGAFIDGLHVLSCCRPRCAVRHWKCSWWTWWWWRWSGARKSWMSVSAWQETWGTKSTPASFTGSTCPASSSSLCSSSLLPSLTWSTLSMKRCVCMC